MQFLDVNETRRLRYTFTDLDGDSANPTTATLTILNPDGTTTTPGPTHDGTAGDYHYDLDPNVAGWWTYTWKGQGGGVDQEESFDLLVGVTPAMAGPCGPWCTWEQVQNLAKPDLSATPAAERERLMFFATAILYGETGKRYPGMCRRTVSIDDCACMCITGWPYDNPVGNDPYWITNYGGGCRWRGCSGIGDHIDFGELRYPLVAVRDVRVLGAVLPTSAWRVDQHRYLVRTDGRTWPVLPDLTDPAQFRATILYGRLPFAGGDDAAAALAAEMAKFYLEGSCNLPANVTDVIRSGITYKVKDAKDLLDDGLSGVPTTDRWLAAEKHSRIPPPGGTDPAIDPSLLRLGTDRGGDR